MVCTFNFRSQMTMFNFVSWKPTRLVSWAMPLEHGSLFNCNRVLREWVIAPGFQSRCFTRGGSEGKWTTTCSHCTCVFSYLVYFTYFLFVICDLTELTFGRYLLWPKTWLRYRIHAEVIPPRALSRRATRMIPWFFPLRFLTQHKLSFYLKVSRSLIFPKKADNWTIF